MSAKQVSDSKNGVTRSIFERFMQQIVTSFLVVNYQTNYVCFLYQHHTLQATRGWISKNGVVSDLHNVSSVLALLRFSIVSIFIVR